MCFTSLYIYKYIFSICLLQVCNYFIFLFLWNVFKKIEENTVFCQWYFFFSFICQMALYRVCVCAWAEYYSFFLPCYVYKLYLGVSPPELYSQSALPMCPRTLWALVQNALFHSFFSKAEAGGGWDSEGGPLKLKKIKKLYRLGPPSSPLDYSLISKNAYYDLDSFFLYI